MATAFAPSTPARVVKQHRRCWKVAPGVYHVISRNGRDIYRVALMTDGSVFCNCPAIDRCWHGDMAKERRLEEVQRGE